jgi:lycopene cyclase domain-containing protein
MPEYTLATVVAMAFVVALELAVFRTGVFRTAQYWVSLAIVLGFQCLVDGYLTRLAAPVVVYRPGHMTGVRWPFDIPIEDFGFAFAMVTFTLLIWRRLTSRPVPADNDMTESA